MGRKSNILISIINFLSFILSLLIVATGVWLSLKAQTDCDKSIQTPVIALGAFLLAVSLAGLIGSCFRISWLLCIYLLVMLLAIVLLFCFAVFAFVVTNPGAGKVLSNRGYKEYRLGDYSHWLQKRVGTDKNWNKIKSCLVEAQVCKSLSLSAPSLADFHSRHLSALQSGCCKPDDNCNFDYVSPTVWNKPVVIDSTLPDCAMWDNNNSTLCFNCGSCRAAVIDNFKRHWKWVAISNIVLMVILVIVYSVGCCAFRNSRAENAYPRLKGYP